MGALPATQFRVKLENGHMIIAYLCGKMCRYYIWVMLGDRVKVEISFYNLEKGRITYRYYMQSEPGSRNEHCYFE
ncbi:MAG: translation initiation factor IF-1 [Anaerolineales bacterium]|nr:translation initiation factor IF-1 [Anaerolineales bacterium]